MSHIQDVHYDFVLQLCFIDVTEAWGPHLPFFKARFTGPASRPYIENLYFTFLFLLRAIMKAEPALRSLPYDTGSPAEDSSTRVLMHRLLSSPRLLTACPEPFNEGLLWQDRDVAERRILEKQLQVRERGHKEYKYAELKAMIWNVLN